MNSIKNIFIVEDDPISALLIKKALNRVNGVAKHHHYLNGQLALNALKQFLNTTGENPDLILLDINMPVMNGWDFLDVISSDPGFSRIKVVILTSSIDPADIERSKSYQNVSGFLSKPLQIDKLRAIIEG